jgi:hypothetical protein
MMGEVPTTVREACAVYAQRGQRALAAIEALLADQHVPHRPQWDCLTCGSATPWPCSPAQVRLLESNYRDLTGLRDYLGTLLNLAIEDRLTDNQRELHDRIVGWIR